MTSNSEAVQDREQSISCMLASKSKVKKSSEEEPKINTFGSKPHQLFSAGCSDKWMLFSALRL